MNMLDFAVGYLTGLTSIAVGWVTWRAIRRWEARQWEQGVRDQYQPITRSW